MASNPHQGAAGPPPSTDGMPPIVTSAVQPPSGARINSAQEPMVQYTPIQSTNRQQAFDPFLPTTLNVLGVPVLRVMHNGQFQYQLPPMAQNLKPEQKQLFDAEMQKVFQHGMVAQMMWANQQRPQNSSDGGTQPMQVLRTQYENFLKQQKQQPQAASPHLAQSPALPTSPLMQPTGKPQGTPQPTTSTQSTPFASPTMGPIKPPAPPPGSPGQTANIVKLAQINQGLQSQIMQVQAQLRAQVAKEEPLPHAHHLYLQNQSQSLLGQQQVQTQQLRQQQQKQQQKLQQQLANPRQSQHNSIKHALQMLPMQQQTQLLMQQQGHLHAQMQLLQKQGQFIMGTHAQRQVMIDAAAALQKANNAKSQKKPSSASQSASSQNATPAAGSSRKLSTLSASTPAMAQTPTIGMKIVQQQNAPQSTPKPPASVPTGPKPIIRSADEITRHTRVKKRIDEAIRRDQLASHNPDYLTEFKDFHDIMDRLMPYHLFSFGSDEGRYPELEESRLDEAAYLMTQKVNKITARVEQQLMKHKESNYFDDLMVSTLLKADEQELLQQSRYDLRSVKLAAASRSS